MAEKNQKKDRGDDRDRSHKKDRHSDRGSDRRGDDSSRRGRSRARRTETKSRSRDRRRRSVEAPGKAVLRPASAEAATTAGGAEKRPEAMASEPAPPGKSAPVVEPDDDDDDEESAEEEAPRAEDAEVEDGPRSTVPKAVTVDSDENECTASTAKAATTEGPAGLKKTSQGSERPPEPANCPHSGPGDPKTGSYKCTVCGRNVGGGLQGNFSHRRSPFHLASWIYYSTSEKKLGVSAWPTLSVGARCSGKRTKQGQETMKRT